MTKRQAITVLAIATAVIIACSNPGDSRKSQRRLEVGDPALARGEGFTHNISASFGPPELQSLYAAITSPSFQASLSEFNCGESVPALRWHIEIEEAGEYNERLIHVAYEPHNDAVAQRCLSFGLSYLFDVAVFHIDKGEPINYHYHDPLTGKELAPEKPHLSRKPHCDCAARQSGREWVTFPEPAPGEPAD